MTASTFASGKPGKREIAPHDAPQMRQPFAETDEPVELAGVARRAPLRVIAVLLSSARVAAGRLQVPARVGTDPDVRVRRRNRQHANAIKHARLAHAMALGIEIDESPARAATRDAGHVVRDVHEASGRRVRADFSDRRRGSVGGHAMSRSSLRSRTADAIRRDA